MKMLPQRGAGGTADQPGGGVGAPAPRRLPWWLGGLIAGAIIGGVFASLGGIVLGLVFVLPFAAARGRAGAAIAGGLVGSGLAAIGIHGILADIATVAAAITLAAGLLLSGAALTKR